jgi:hypothetical protein
MHAPGGGLFAAGWYDDVENLKLLIDAGADVDVVVGVTPFLACWHWKKFAAAKYLAKRGADVLFRDPAKHETAYEYGVRRKYDPSLLRWITKLSTGSTRSS